MDLIVIQSQAYKDLLKDTFAYIQVLFSQHQNHSNEWLDNDQLMKLLKVSRRSIQNWRDQGLITFSQVGNKIYYNRAEVDTFLENHSLKSFNK